MTEALALLSEQPALDASNQPFSPLPTSGLGDDALLARADTGDGWQGCADELLRIRGLEEDWDGAGAEAPPTAVVDSVLRLVQQLRQNKMRAPTRIVAGLDGTVILEWQSPERYQEIEVVEPFRAELLVRDKGEPSRHTTFSWR